MARLPAGTNVRWHARTSADVIDFAALQLDNGGYATGDAAAAASWVVACCRAWLGVLKADPISREELNSAAGHTPDMTRSGEDLGAITDWIFQATPKRYDVHAAVAKSRQDWWNTPRYREQIAINDRVWLQIAGPHAPGIYYLATIMSLPYETEPEDGETPTFGHWRTDIRFDYSIDPPLLREELLN